MNDSGDRTSIVCATCRRPLDIIEGPDGTISYMHAAAASRGVTPHRPVPMEVSSQLDVIGCCDFCGSFDVTVIYPCETFEVVALGRVSVSDWSACGRCHADIEEGRWVQVRRRAVDNFEYPVAYRESVEATIGVLHNAFRTHRTGPFRPISDS